MGCNPVRNVDPNGTSTKVFQPHVDGDIGELNLSQALDDSGKYEVLAFDPSRSGSRSGGGGFDMVAYDKGSGQLLIIYNKALSGTIDDVSAFNGKNFDQNLERLKEQLRASGVEYDKAALKSIEENNFKKVVSNAYSKENAGFSKKLFSKNIDVLDVRTGKMYSNYKEYSDDIKAYKRAAKARGGKPAERRTVAQGKSGSAMDAAADSRRRLTTGASTAVEGLGNRAVRKAAKVVASIAPGASFAITCVEVDCSTAKGFAYALFGEVGIGPLDLQLVWDAVEYLWNNWPALTPSPPPVPAGVPGMVRSQSGNRVETSAGSFTLGSDGRVTSGRFY